MAKVTLEQVIAEDAQGYAEAMNKAVQQAGGDPDKLRELINEVNKTRVEAAQKALDARLEAEQKHIKENQAKVDAFMAHVSDVLGKAWADARLTEQLNDIPADVMQRVSFTVYRDPESGKPMPAQVLHGQKSTPKARPASKGGEGVARGQGLTVNGKTYESANAAKKELLPQKADASMNRASIISALKTAGHTVQE